MQKLKKIMCLLLSALMVLSINIPAIAVDNTQTNNSISTNTANTSPLTIEISTDKEKYSTLNIAEFTATVTNTSNEPVENVSAEAIFTDLAPVSRKSEIKKEANVLQEGESISFTYRATLNKSEHDLNIIQKIFLWIIRLFNGGFTAGDNGFDNGRDYIEKKDTFIFGKFNADNTVRVWYGESEDDPIIPDEEKAVKAFTEYFDVKEDVNAISEKYETNDGYILQEDVESVINEIAEYAEQALQQGLIKDYGAEIENNCVWIDLKNGIHFIYTPNIEGIDSVDISSYQPCLFTYSIATQERSKEATDGSAETIQNRIEDYYFTNNYDNEEITLDTIKSIGDNEVVIWHGHGLYDTTCHSALMTNIKLDEARFLLDPIYYIAKIGYTADYLSGRIVCTDKGYVCVTYKFFEHYLNNLNNTFIYLGTCSSGKDDVLANTFINKGATAVVANTDIIHTDYNLDMIETICQTMTEVSQTTANYYTLDEALNIAKEKNGSICCSELPNTEVRIWGNSNYRYNDEEIEISIPSTAVEFNGHYYQVYDTPMTWYEAKAYCESLGGHLATITSSNEQTFITTLINDKSMRSYFLGALKIEGKWSWVTDESFSYTNWYPNEPNGSGNCLQIFRIDNGYDAMNNGWDNTWNDGDHGGGIKLKDIGFICEWDTDIDKTACITQMKIINYDKYTGNQGDSNFTALDGSYTLHDSGRYYGYTNMGVDGNTYENGFCVWIARWNFKTEISWASATCKLNGKYSKLTGKTELLKSYNTTNFNTTIYFYDGETLLQSYTLTNSDYNKDICVDVSGVKELRILVKDNIAVKGGTSFALYDMFLT